MKKNNKECFSNYHCSIDCPNFQISYIDEKYGFGIADDLGFKETKCSQCLYNSGECKDCFFKGSADCPYNE